MEAGPSNETPLSKGTAAALYHKLERRAYRDGLLTPPPISSSSSSSNSSSITGTSSASSPTKVLTFFDWLKDEATSGYGLEWKRTARTTHHVVNFLSVPFRLEPFLSYGTFLCLDLFLFHITYLPLRFLVALLALIQTLFSWGCSQTFGWRSRPQITRAHAYDLLKGLIIIVAVSVLGLVQVSRVYHYIRGEAIIKLYVVVSILEVLDQLFCSLGVDVMDALYRTTRDHLSLPGLVAANSATSSGSGTESPAMEMNVTFSDASITVDPFAAALRLAFHFVVAVGYTLAHAMVLFVQVVCLNVAINGRNNALLTLLVSNNFVELKGSVFKRFEAENLFQVSCADTVERFQLVLFLFLISLQEGLSSGGEPGTLLALCPSFVAIFLCEVLVDLIKHSFISKFNRLHADLYKTFSAIISQDLLSARQRNKTSLDPTHTCAKRLGLATLPFTVLCTRMVMTLVDVTALTRINTVSGVATVILSVLCLFAAKALISLLLQVKAATVIVAMKEESLKE